MQIHNYSLRTFGGNKKDARHARVHILIPSETGALLSKSGKWVNHLSKSIKRIQARATINLIQTYKMKPDARNHSRVPLHFDFHISAPKAIDGSPLNEISEKLTQTMDHYIQIAASHKLDQNADVLLVTNSETRKDRCDRIRDFIQTQVRLKVAVGNVSLYGGLEESNNDPED
ncbi:hypothetical protein G7Y89_g8990 [Cudoniella acicularis]|uniref:Uncharacterized protein n=1 Tax=Cudoniella acicularis TaxID=354080 RepID=A0A8H4W028_9HELO|nr:hypothetical protein G7Y89_g8990 [Cudoniella acicularis]